MAPRRLTPEAYRRCSAPIQSSRSGFTGFLTRTVIRSRCSGVSDASASAISWTANGLAVVRAPIQKSVTPVRRACRRWTGVAISVTGSIPVLSRTSASHARARTPMPSNEPGLVRGFQTPARNTRMPVSDSSRAVRSVCSRLSALHGPAITSGPQPSRTPPNRGFRASIFTSVLSISLQI